MGRPPALAAIAAALALAGAAGAALVVARRPPPGPPPGVLHLRITDGPGGPPIAARVVLDDGVAPLRWGRIDMYGKRQANGCVLADGALGTHDGLLVWRGDAELRVGPNGCEPWPALPPGRWRVRAWRGIEHEIWEGEVELAHGTRTELTIPLERAFRVDGAVVADMHVHAAGSNDSGVPLEHRVIAMLAAGVEMIGLSDHFVSGDLDEAIARLGVADRIASIASNEIGNDGGHYGVYPAPVVPGQPRGGSPAPDELARWRQEEVLAWARRWAPGALIQVNHPRFRMYALFDGRGWDGARWPPPFPLDFDVIEVLAGHTVFNAPGDRRADEGVRDLYALVGRGKLVIGLGNSDTHHLNGVRDGLTRSYVFVDGPDRLDEVAFLAAVRARRAVATSGPWLDVEVTPAGGGRSAGPGEAVSAPGGEVIVDVEVAQARWSRADELRLRVGTADGGHRILEAIPIPPGERTVRISRRLTLGPRDTWIGVDASGDAPLPWQLTGSYHRERGHDAVPYAVINPILIDADGDGRVRFGIADEPVAP